MSSEDARVDRGWGGAALCAVLTYTGVTKLTGNAPTHSEFWSWLVSGPSWVVVGVVELALGALLILLPSRPLWRVLQGLLGGAVLVHAYQVSTQGATGAGCGCFGAQASASAGLDALLATGVLLIGVAGWRVDSRPRLIWWALLLVGVGSVVSLLFLGDLLVPVSGRHDTTQSIPLAETRTVEAPSLLGTGDRGPEGAEDDASGAVTVGRIEVQLTVLSADRTPVEGATAALFAENGEPREQPVIAITDEGGRVTLDVAGGSDLIVVTHPHYQRAVLEIEGLGASKEDPTIRLTVELEKGASLTVVAEGVDGTPVANIPIRVSEIETSVPEATRARRDGGAVLVSAVYEVRTSSSGAAVFANLRQATTYRVEPAPSAGLIRVGRGQRRYVQPEGQTLRMALATTMVSWIRAVDDETGLPVAGVRWYTDRLAKYPAELLSPQIDLDVGSVSGLRGRTVDGDYLEVRAVASGGLAEQRFSWGTVGVVAYGYESAEMPRTYSKLGALSTPLEIRLKRSPNAAFGEIVFESSSSPTFPRGTVIELWPEHESAVRRDAISRRLGDRDTGRYSLGRVQAGRYTLRVSASADTRTFIVQANKTATVKVGVADAGLIRFRVEKGDSAFTGFVELFAISPRGGHSVQVPRVAVREGVSDFVLLPANRELVISVGTHANELAVVRTTLTAGKTSEVDVKLK